MNPQYESHLQDFAVYVKTTFLRLMEGTEEINAWVRSKTSGMISKTVDAKALVNAHLILLNALAFKGVWQMKFNPKDTIRGYPFNTSSSGTVPVDMMFLRGSRIIVSWKRGYSAMCLPYKTPPSGQAPSFIAYLPDPNKSLLDVVEAIRHEGVPTDFRSILLAEFGLPTLEMETDLDIYPVLGEVGFPLSRDFPEMGPGPNLVASILHKTFISLDEEGTRAAPITAIKMGRGRGPKSLVFNRPFAFSIVTGNSNLPLFIGVFSP
jgi:serine protease inhibitor